MCRACKDGQTHRHRGKNLKVANSEMLGFRLSKKMAADIRAQARAEHTTTAMLIRKILAEHLQKRELDDLL